jgi:hypothetical protein
VRGGVVEIIPQREIRKGVRERVDRVVERRAENEAGDFRRERIYRVVETAAELYEREGRW